MARGRLLQRTRGRKTSAPAAPGPRGLLDRLRARLRLLADDRLAFLLLAVNLIPVACVLVLGWDVGELMLFYWAENVVIGVFIAAKMIAAGYANRPLGLVSAVFCVPFFVLHYGVFCLAHGFLILVLMAMAAQGGAFPIPFSVLGDLIRAQVGVQAGLAALVLFHGTAFTFDWLAKGEARRTTPGDLMFSAYGRTGVLHLALIGGMMLVLILGQPVWTVFMLAMAKTVFELVQRKPPAPATVTRP